LLALAGCTGTALDDVLLLRGDSSGSAYTRCETRKLESLSEGFTTVDQLACDCQAIDGRAPECWGYTEYSGRPMPLALKAESEARS